MKTGPSLARIARGDALPSIPELPQTPENNVTANIPLTQEQFENKAKEWGKGTLAEYAIYEYTARKGMRYYPYPQSTDTPVFIVGSLAWRLLEDKVHPNKADLFFNRSKLENKGFTVVDIKAQNLQYGMIDNTLDLALRGIEVNVG